MEKAYLTMKNSGAGSIAIGIIVLVVDIRERSHFDCGLSASLLRGTDHIRSVPC